ncbi:MAG: hypothetical protein SGPRY_006920 [Prymnesium sp.]
MQRPRRRWDEKAGDPTSNPSSMPSPSSFIPSSTIASASERTAQLLRERGFLLDRLRQIDKAIDEERDRKRRALTEQYERDLAMLEEEAAAMGQLPAKPAPTLSNLREQLASAIASGPHQDVAHQDIDIDVALTHIDTNGDGIITRAEVKDASTGAIALRHSFGIFFAIIGCAAGIEAAVALSSSVARVHLSAKTETCGLTWPAAKIGVCLVKAGLLCDLT